jgi:hypothetical protein
MDDDGFSAFLTAAALVTLLSIFGPSIRTVTPAVWNQAAQICESNKGVKEVSAGFVSVKVWCNNDIEVDAAIRSVDE